MSDLYKYVRHNRNLSGIQRVIVNLAMNIDAWRRQAPNVDVAMVIRDRATHDLYTVELAPCVTMMELLVSQRGGRRDLNRAIREMTAGRRRVEPAAGDALVIAGAFWIYDNFMRLAQLRDRGVMIGFFIHDLIQIKHPELVHAGADAVFRKLLVDALCVAHFVMANSQFTADELTEFIEQNLNFSIPVVPVPLATELPPLKESDDPVDPEALKVVPGSFVLCVGTIEMRKNHIYLVRIWERLRAEGTPIPDLVIAGKWGWDTEPFRDQIKDNDLGGQLKIFEAPSDATLAHLYQTCLMTAYPSLAEGFGLPVGESFGYGKPCVTSNVTALPEVGGRLARYLDPRDVEQGAALFRSIFADPPAIAAWARDIRETFRSKTWESFAGEFYSVVAGFVPAAAARDRTVNGHLATGRFYRVGNEEARWLTEAGERVVTARPACLSGWHDFESWGCWASDRRTHLRFRTDHPEGSRLIVRMELFAPRGSHNARCTIEAGAGPHPLELGPQLRAFDIPAQTKADGVVDIDLVSSGWFGLMDPRRLYVGLHALALVRPGEEGAPVLRGHDRIPPETVVDLARTASLKRRLSVKLPPFIRRRLSRR